MLLQVLYKHLISLIQQNAVLVDEKMHGKLTFDLLINYIKENARFNEDSSGIVIACQLMKKALRGLRLIPKKGMAEQRRLYIKLI